MADEAVGPEFVNQPAGWERPPTDRNRGNRRAGTAVRELVLDAALEPRSRRSGKADGHAIGCGDLRAVRAANRQAQGDVPVGAVRMDSVGPRPGVGGSRQADGPSCYRPPRELQPDVEISR